MSEWQLIDSAPRDGTKILLFWPSWAYEVDDASNTPVISIGWWTTNSRLEIPTYISVTEAEKLKEDLRFYNIPSAGYFTDQNESDCIGQAQAHNFPTHWMPLPEPPKPIHP